LLWGLAGRNASAKLATRPSRLRSGSEAAAELLLCGLGGATEHKPEVGRANTKLLVELAGQGKLKPRISHRFPLERAAEAVQTVIDRKVIGKAVLVG